MGVIWCNGVTALKIREHVAKRGEMVADKRVRDSRGGKGR